MTDFLLELRCEEIPARMQAKASDDLARLFTEQLAQAGLKPERITSYVTPRRLALIAHGLPGETQAVSEEFKGPRTSAPEQALEGFLRKTGLAKDQLEDRDGVWFAVVEKPGRATADVLSEAIPAIIRAFPWPKSMRWGAASETTESLRWVRPLQGIVALLGEELVAIEVEGVTSGYATVGHRFHHPGIITIGSAADYVEKLRACHVIVDQEERKAIIESRAKALAGEAGYELIEDAGLVAENAGLTEWPVPLLGHFDPAFLEVPPEVIQLTLRINQKYFVLRSADGKLAPAFICTANIEAKDGGAAIVAGNGKVLAARLSDARFFWEQDKKTPLEEHAKKLSRITFHEKLGTVADKVERVAKLARWLVEEGIVSSPPLPFRGGAGGGASRDTIAPGTNPHPNPSPEGEGLDRAQLADLAEQAAKLCKADLVTEMVGEFPELQGLMGGYYARAEGLPNEVADAIRDHYKPVGQGDEVPTAPVTVAVSLADKLDTIAQFFSIEEKPTGSKDPFALRRAALGSIALIERNGLRLDLIFAALQAAGQSIVDRRFSPKSDALSHAIKAVGKALDAKTGPAVLDALGQVVPQVLQPTKEESARGFQDLVFMVASVRDFFLDRLEVAMKDQGVSADLIRAAQIIDGDGGKESDLVRLLARVRALQSFIETADGANLLAGYKRAANILKKEGYDDSGAPAMATAESQGIAQTGEEDPLALVEEPAIAEAVAEMAQGQPAAASAPAPEPAESALSAALDAAEPRAAAAIEAEDFEGAMAALASLRAPIDSFFESVIVNDPEPAKRSARLALLQRVRVAVHKVADFSRIGG
ncbi:glycine--tRNA ligase subunit beta [Sphingobium sp. DEHP117]|uniref:glycine--tRNA ligase subunit beta n=1 Tax=Sphingobium sp. DEHP117 TaxID=2993436 RepID=UPI0027D5E59A|nr:glycine--tRNA ligase subunit beta [Sphingobium sp. DEHP117]MDQ4420054.1 glycine--tRNA ligase subunit beta [Sphingobium sp. DEHP117]